MRGRSEAGTTMVLVALLMAIAAAGITAALAVGGGDDQADQQLFCVVMGLDHPAAIRAAPDGEPVPGLVFPDSAVQGAPEPWGDEAHRLQEGYAAIERGGLTPTERERLAALFERVREGTRAFCAA